MSIFGDNPLETATGTAPANQTDSPTVAVDGPPVAPASPEVGTATAGPVVNAGETTDQAVEKTYFDPDGYRDHLVKLKVAGEEVELPLSEALSNAMRGQDYTRKTQELAEERRRLHQADMLAAALDSDPARTIKQLAEIYDLDSSGLQPVQREPEEQRLVERERVLAQREAEVQQLRIQNEIASLTQQYGDFDVPAVADFALKHRIDLETAYKAMNYEALRSAQAEQTRQEAARGAARNAQVVHSGANTQRGSVNNGPEKVETIHDAWRLAEKQLKLT